MIFPQKIKMKRWSLTFSDIERVAEWTYSTYAIRTYNRTYWERSAGEGNILELQNSTIPSLPCSDILFCGSRQMFLPKLTLAFLCSSPRQAGIVGYNLWKIQPMYNAASQISEWDRKYPHLPADSKWWLAEEPSSWWCPPYRRVLKFIWHLAIFSIQGKDTLPQLPHAFPEPPCSPGMSNMWPARYY